MRGTKLFVKTTAKILLFYAEFRRFARVHGFFEGAEEEEISLFNFDRALLFYAAKAALF